MKKDTYTYTFEQKGIQAYGCKGSRNKFVVRKGSYAVADSEIRKSFKLRIRRIKIRDNLIASGKLTAIAGKYQFTTDVEFNSPSEAASIIWGSMLNGKKTFGID